MLVLTRRIDESIVIANNITITILSIEGDKVKIGINAPREIPILRQELWQAIQEQNRSAEKPDRSGEPDNISDGQAPDDQAELGEQDNSDRDA
ncbi:MAG TPA: carbon storage regulator CsrA [Anaerolineales bacterium]